MKINKMATLCVAATLLFTAGCDLNTNTIAALSDTNSTPIQGVGGPQSGLSPKVTQAIEAPASTLTPELKEKIAYMYSEEWLAYDLYLALNKLYPDAIQLKNIALNSETKHIEAVDLLAQKYDLNLTQYPGTSTPYDKEGIGGGVYPVEPVQTLYDLLYAKGSQSKQDALEVGCIVEVIDVIDLNEDIELALGAGATDVASIFEFLREGSYKHYWEFDSALKQMGVDQGCCAVEPLSDYPQYDFCQPDFPNPQTGGPRH